jgi:hypothetical protein
MADDDPNRLKGISCTATLDYAAQTLTFEHRGKAAAVADSDTTHDADGQAEPKPDGKVTKAVDGVLDFFSRFN